MKDLIVFHKVGDDEVFQNKRIVMNHEKLKCYQELLIVAEEIAKMVARWPRGYAYLTDQITRAIISAVLNLCEGNGKRSSSHAERRRFFQISLGSITETSSGLDLAYSFRLTTQKERDFLKSHLKSAYVKINALP